MGQGTGISQYLKYGTGGSADTYAGRVVGGSWDGDSQGDWVGAAGGSGRPGWGIAKLGGSAQIEVADATLLSYFTRRSFTNPSLQALTFEGAYANPTGAGWTQTSCYLSTIEVSLSVSSPLTATIGWEATDEAAAGSYSAPTAGASMWQWYHGQCTLNGATYYLQSMRMSASNSLEAWSSVEAKSINQWRLPTAFHIGKQVVSLSCEMYSTPSTSLWNIHEDVPISNAGAVIKTTDGAHTLTFTLANLLVKTHRMPFEGEDGAVLYSLEMAGNPYASDTLTIAYS